MKPPLSPSNTANKEKITFAFKNKKTLVEFSLRLIQLNHEPGEHLEISKKGLKVEVSIILDNPQDKVTTEKIRETIAEIYKIILKNNE